MHKDKCEYEKVVMHHVKDRSESQARNMIEM